MKTINELQKEGMQYLTDVFDEEIYKKHIEKIKTTVEETIEEFIQSGADKVPVEKLFEKFGKVIFFEDLEEESMPGIRFSMYGVPEIAMIYVFNETQCIWTKPVVGAWPPMDDWRFGTPADLLESVITAIKNMPEEYRAKLIKG